MGPVRLIWTRRSFRRHADIVISENKKKLGEEDRKLSQGQKFCAVQREFHLGIMGVPTKVMVTGETVFLCCEACLRKVLKDPDATRAKVKELKTKTAASREN